MVYMKLITSQPLSAVFQFVYLCYSAVGAWQI